MLWSARQAGLIRAGRLDLVDWQNVAEEIESLGGSERRQLGNRLEVLIRHLLKWQFQPVHARAAGAPRSAPSAAASCGC